MRSLPNHSSMTVIEPTARQLQAFRRVSRAFTTIERINAHLLRHPRGALALADARNAIVTFHWACGLTKLEGMPACALLAFEPAHRLEHVAALLEQWLKEPEFAGAKR